MPGLAEAIDPAIESAYRRGYRHGARAIVAAAQEHLPRECAQALREYVETELAAWGNGQAFEPPKVRMISEAQLRAP